MSKKNNGPVIKKGLDGWFATYSDMVTLLFCFFVMLYAASNQEEARFQYILQAFSTSGRYVNTVVGREMDPPLPPSGHVGNSGIPPQQAGDMDGNPPGQTNEQHVFDSLYLDLVDTFEEEGIEGAQVFMRQGQIRILLDNDIMFDGNSSDLKPEGVRVLNLITPSIKSAQDYIASVEVQGHTANTGMPNVGVDDWELSSLRAVSIVQHLHYVNQMVAGEKFRAEGYAQYHPIGDNSTPEGRASNRRAEIIINRIELSEEENRLVDDIMKHDYNNPIFDVDYSGGIIQQPGIPVESRVASILSDLAERYGLEDLSTEQPHPPTEGTTAGQRPGGFINVVDADFEDSEETDNPAGGVNGNGVNGYEDNGEDIQE
ncbi:MAG: OmpA family protein [Oscillospiraceae bacterium]|nr:OmpA family protein [Oscillospiraceae bacterium]